MVCAVTGNFRQARNARAAENGQFYGDPAENAGPRVAGRVSRYFQVLHEAHEKEQRAVLEQCKPQAPLAWLRGPPDAAQGSVTGRSRLAVMRKTLDMFGLVRSKNQREFHREMIKSALPLIFKDDLDENLDDLLREFECSEFKSEVMIITPRRWGKTYSVAMFVVACAAGIENLEQAIFSTSRRASKKLLDLVFKLLRKIPLLRDSVIVRNVETIWIRGPSGDIRKIYSYPSKVTSRARVCVPLQPSAAPMQHRK